MGVLSGLTSLAIATPGALRFARFFETTLSVPSSLMLCLHSISPTVLKFLSVRTRSMFLSSPGTAWRIRINSLKYPPLGREIAAVKEEKYVSFENDYYYLDNS